MTLSIASCSGLNLPDDEAFIPCIELNGIYTSDEDVITDDTYNSIDEFNAMYKDLC